MTRQEKLEQYSAARAKSFCLAEELEELDLLLRVLYSDGVDETNPERVDSLEDQWTSLNKKLLESYKETEKLNNELFV